MAGRPREEVAMSIDVAVRMYFPAASVADVLGCLADLTRHGNERTVTIALPQGESFVICHADSSSGIDMSRPLVLGPGTRIGLIETCLSSVVRKKKKLPRKAKPRVNQWGDLENFEVVKVRTYYQLLMGLSRGRDYLEVALHNVTSSGVNFFHTAPFRAKLARLFTEGSGVAAVEVGMGEWTSFAEPHTAIETPAAWQEMEDEDMLDIDALAEQLRAAL
jgi:hypothetical protein